MSAATISVPAGGDLQGALDRAVPGDTILLAAATEYVGNFVLPVKSGDAWITLRTATPDTLLPPAGYRINPSHASLLPRLRSANSIAALRTAAGAHHWRLAYLELRANYNGYGDILQIGDGSSEQNTLDRVPHHIVLEHLYVHGDERYGQKRGIALNAAHVRIADSYISACKAVGQDSQAIAGWNGPGPYLIENNYLEAAAENFLLGGADPAIANLVADGVTFRRNYLSRPMAWRNPIVATPQNVRLAAEAGGSLPSGVYAYRVVARRPVGQGVVGRSTASIEVSATLTAAGAVRVRWDAVAGATEYRVYGRSPGAQNVYWRVTSTELVDTGTAGTTEAVPTSAGTRWSVKNLFELKSARNVIVENNIMENHWQESQPGYAVVFTPRNSNGGCTWCVVENVRVEYNIVRNVSAGVNLTGRDIPERPTRQTRNIAFRHNLFQASTTLGGNGYFMIVGDAPRDVAIEHNTIDANGASVVYVYGGTATSPATISGFQMIANASRHGTYGMGGAFFTAGYAILDNFYPDALFTANYLAGGSTSAYPAGNLFAGTFANQFASVATGDYTVLPASPLKRGAPGGLDIGVDFPALAARTAGVMVGVPPGGGAPVPPHADFTFSCAFLNCTFTSTSSPGSVPIGATTWTFGDGASGAGATATRSYAASGTYAVTLNVTDGNGLVSSATHAVTAEARTLPPDLSIMALTVPVSGRPGTAIQVTEMSRNVGSGAADGSLTHFYLSRDTRLDAADTFLGSRMVASLAPGASSAATTVLALHAALQAGAYFVLAQADGDNTLAESNESNNGSSAAITIQPDTVTRPDLLTTALTVPSSGAAGGSITVSSTTANQGAGSAATSTTRFFLSPTLLLTSTAIPLQTRSVGALAPGGVSTGPSTLTIPAGTAPGAYFLLAQADADGSVTELNEGNNTRWAAIVVGPDLHVSSLLAPTRAVPGSTLTVTTTIRNAGAGAAAPSSVDFYLSTNPTLDPSDLRLQPSRSVPALAASASSTGAVAVTVPYVPVGIWYLIAKVDDANDVSESNELNNAAQVNLFIGPDLTFVSAALPTTAVAGTAVSATFTLRNGGLMAAAASAVRFYLSNDYNFDATDVRLGSAAAVPALAADAWHTATLPVTLPATLSGACYILLVADGDQVIQEVVETNNTIARAIQITR